MSSEPSVTRDPLLPSVLRLAESSDLSVRLDGLAGDAVALVPGSVAAVYLLDEEGALRPIAASPLDVAALTTIDVPRLEMAGGLDPAAAAWLDRQETVVAAGGANASAFLATVSSAQSAIYVPLALQRPHAEPDVEGVLALACPSTVPEGWVRETLRGLAALAALAARDARLEAAVEERSDWFDRLSHTDPLTGLANRRTLDRVLELELARAARQGTALCVAIFALDGHAQVSAQHGAHAADDLLRRVSAALSDAVRLVDTVARYDRGTFVVVAPGSNGRAMAERAASAVRQAGPGIGDDTVTVHVGVAAFPRDGTTAETLLASATRALEEARAGAGPIVEAG